MARNVAYLLISALALASCQQAVGPSRSEVTKFPGNARTTVLPENISIIELTPTALAALRETGAAISFSVVLGDAVMSPIFTTSQAAKLQRFVNTIASIVLPVVSVTNSVGDR